MLMSTAMHANDPNVCHQHSVTRTNLQNISEFLHPTIIRQFDKVRYSKVQSNNHTKRGLIYFQQN